VIRQGENEGGKRLGWGVGKRKHKRRTRKRSDTYKNLPSRKRTPQETKDRSHTQRFQNKSINETETIAKKKVNIKAVKWDRERSRETEKRREIAGECGGSGREQKRTTTAAAKATGETERENLKKLQKAKSKAQTKAPPNPKTLARMTTYTLIMVHSHLMLSQC